MIEKNPRYDGLYVFKLDLRKLQSGDVILTRNTESTSIKGKVKSNVIAKVTRGNFSHALLCTIPPILIEAIGGDGVSNISAQRCFAHDLKSVRVLRYTNQQIASAAGSAALMLLGQEYSVSSAIHSVIPGKPVSEPLVDQTFCSALVATAFKAAGAPDFATIDPMKTTPATLEKAALFTDVTSQLFIRILSPSNIERMSPLDGDRIPSSLAGQAKILGSYYAKISPLIQNLFDPYPSLTNRKPVSFFECLLCILHGFSACERLPRSVEADNFRNQLISIDNVAFDLLAEGKMKELVCAAQRIEDEDLKYTISESFKPKPDINLVDTQGLILATREQIASRSSILNTEMPVGYSRAWDEWLKITREVVEIQDRRLLALEEVVARVFPSAKAQS
jgi:hypothetical protein